MAQKNFSSSSIMKFLMIKSSNAIENVNRINVKIFIIPMYQLMFAATLIMFLIHNAKTIAQYSDCLFALTSTLTASSVVITIIWNIQNLNELIKYLECTLKKRRENPASKIIYEKLDRRIETYTSALYFFCIRLTVYGLMSINFVMAMVAYFTTGLKDYDPRFLFPIWFPFKQNLFTYLVQFMLQGISLYLSVVVICFVFCFLMEFCFKIMAYAEDLKAEIKNLNGLDMSEESEQNRFRGRIFELISFHSHTKQCVDKFVDAYGEILTMYVVCCLLGICQSLLIFESEISKESPDNLLIIQSIMKILHGSGVIFLFCEFGEQLSGQFDELNDDIGQLNWHSFLIDMQRVILIIMANTQQPTQISGFGNIVCGRNTFKRIVNASWTYFMIFRGIE